MKTKIKNSFSKISVGYLFIMPWIIGLLALVIIPFIQSFNYTFNNVRVGANGVVLIPSGLENYVYSLTLDPQFTTALFNTFKSMIIMIPLIIVLSIFISVLLNYKVKVIGIFRTIFFLPVIILSGPIVTLLGEINAFGDIDSFLATIDRMTSHIDGLVISIILGIILYLIQNIMLILWFCGIPIIIFLVTLQKINPDLYEAAQMDGAGSWEKFWKIILPELKMPINISILYLVVQMSTFDINPVSTMIKENMFDLDKGLGYASTQAWIYMLLLIVVILILLLAMNGLPKRRKKEKKPKAHKIKKSKEEKKIIKIQRKNKTDKKNKVDNEVKKEAS